MKRTKFSNILILIFLSLITIIPFFRDGFFAVHDNTQVARVFEMTKALRDGMFPVRWVADLGYGYGYPIFNFYAPLPYYIGAFLSLLGIDIVIATKIMFIVPIVLSGVFMYLFINDLFGKIAGYTGAVVYLYFPYHAINAYIRGDVGELYVYMFLPLAFWGIHRIIESSQKKILSYNWILLISVAVGGIIVSHNLSAFMFLLLLIPFFTYYFFVLKHKLYFFIMVFSAFFLAFLLSAFYSVPAILEMKYTNVASQIGGGANYVDHFVCLPQLWNSAWGFGGSTKGCVDGMSFRLGKINILVSIISIITAIYLMFKKKKQDRFVSASIMLLFISLFFMLPYSLFIWRIIPFMSYLQYPWRFLNFAGFFMSILVGYFIFQLSTFWNKKIGIIFSSLIVLLTITTNAKLFVPQNYENNTTREYSSKNYLRYTVSKISDEYLPKGFKTPKTENDIPAQRVEIIDGNGRVQNISEKTGDITATVVAVSDSIVRLNIAYFPAWSIQIDGDNAAFAQKNDGVFVILPSGIHTIQAKFASTFVEKIGNSLSVFGIFVLVFGIIKLKNAVYAKHRKTN